MMERTQSVPDGLANSSILKHDGVNRPRIAFNASSASELPLFSRSKKQPKAGSKRHLVQSYFTRRHTSQQYGNDNQQHSGSPSKANYQSSQQFTLNSSGPINDTQASTRYESSRKAPQTAALNNNPRRKINLITCGSDNYGNTLGGLNSKTFFNSNCSSPMDGFGTSPLNRLLGLTDGCSTASQAQMRTFSYTNAVFSNRIKIAASRGLSGGMLGIKSEYLDRMQNNKTKKLHKLYDHEKGKTKAKRQLLQSLQFELEQLKMLNGTLLKQNAETNTAEAESFDQIISPQSELQQSDKPIKSIRNSLSMQILRPSLANLGSKLAPIEQNLNISNNNTLLGNQIQQQSNNAESQKTLNLNYFKPSPQMTSCPQLSVSIYQPYYTMAQDDETITANLLKMRSDLEAQVKEIEFKRNHEFLIKEKLVHKQINEKQQITALTFRTRDLLPDQRKYDLAVESIPRIQMLGATSREQNINLIGERKKELERKRSRYQSMLMRQIDKLKVESKSLDELQAAIAKREKRVAEVKEYLKELKKINKEEEHKQKDIIGSLMGKNLEYKVLSGLEIIVKLEEALKAVESIKEEEYVQMQGVDILKSVKTNVIEVNDLTPEDFEIMNKKKIEMLQSYEQHFSAFFPNLISIKINDDYLQKRYNDICFSINSQTSKFNELAQTCNVKRNFIQQFQKLKVQVEKDREFLKRFNVEQDIEAPKNFHKSQTLNEMKGVDFEMNSGVIILDHLQKRKILARAFLIMNNVLQKQDLIILPFTTLEFHTYSKRYFQCYGQRIQSRSKLIRSRQQLQAILMPHFSISLLHIPTNIFLLNNQLWYNPQVTL